VSASSSAPIRIVVMEGDGIGPEITADTMGVLHAADRLFKLGFDFSPVTIGLEALRKEGTTLTDAAAEAARAADGVILGPVSHNVYPPVAQGGLNPSGELRKRLDLYANIRPAKSRGGFPPRCGSPVDLVIVRENTEGFYADRAVFSVKGISPEGFLTDPDALEAEGVPAEVQYPPMSRYDLFQPHLSRLPVCVEHADRLDPATMSFPVAESAGEREALYLNENVFRAGRRGVEDAVTAIAKVQQHAHELAALPA